MSMLKIIHALGFWGRVKGSNKREREGRYGLYGLTLI